MSIEARAGAQTQAKAEAEAREEERQEEREAAKAQAEAARAAAAAHAQAEVQRHKALWARSHEEQLSWLTQQGREATWLLRQYEKQLAAKAQARRRPHPPPSPPARWTSPWPPSDRASISPRSRRGQEAALLSASLHRALATLAAAGVSPRHTPVPDAADKFELVHVLAEIGDKRGQYAGSLVRFRGELSELRPATHVFRGQRTKSPDLHGRMHAVVTALEDARGSHAPTPQPPPRPQSGRRPSRPSSARSSTSARPQSARPASATRTVW